ncbi:MAG TPA: hypothetical protein V6C58_05470 [Allocoleopsis sp.]
MNEPFYGSFTVEKIGSNVEYPYAKIYRLGATLRTEYQITNKMEDDMHSTIIKDMTNKLVYHMFGEFKPYFYEIRNALYNRDISKAIELLNKFEDQMFT